MARMAFDTRGCGGVTSGATGKTYNAKDGIITVTDQRDIKSLAAGGYTVLGTTVRTKRYWTCEGCGRDAAINHCPKCDREDLTRVEA